MRFHWQYGVALFIGSVFSCKALISKSSGSADSRYTLAYNYILDRHRNSLQNRIVVADSIAYIEIAPFFEELSIAWRKPKQVVLHVLDSLDNANHFKPTYSKYLSHLKDYSSSDANAVLYFSENKGNIVAEVLSSEKSGLVKASYDQRLMFNIGVRYLFVFDKKGQILQVYNKTIQYN